MADSPENSALAADSGRSWGLWLLMGGMVLSWVVLGLAGTSNYFDSEDHLGKVQQEMYEKGATASIGECVDLVLEWHPQCTALHGLCDASVDRVMGACLAGHDRTEECRELADRLGKTQYGVPECRGRGIERRQGQDRECAKSFGTVSLHCKELLPDVFADVKEGR